MTLPNIPNDVFSAAFEDSFFCDYWRGHDAANSHYLHDAVSEPFFRKSLLM